MHGGAAGGTYDANTFLAGEPVTLGMTVRTPRRERPPAALNRLPFREHMSERHCSCDRGLTHFGRTVQHSKGVLLKYLPREVVGGSRDDYRHKVTRLFNRRVAPGEYTAIYSIRKE